MPSDITNNKDPEHFLWLCALVGGGVAAAAAYWFRRSQKQLPPPKQHQQPPHKPLPAAPTVNNPWHERQQRGIAAANGRKQVAYTDKPFESKYYYAHNNSSATGGYKDGLRMEDYTMNQPRLLSRGSGAPNDATTPAANESPPPAPANPLACQKRAMGKPTRSIARYLWDDPGKSNGVASIRVDKLPSLTSSTETTPWSEVYASLDDANRDIQFTTVADNGLRVTVDAPKVRYELKMDSLYGKITKAESSVTSKRLVIKLHKQKKSIVWPHPHQSKAKSS